ncbi:MAG TPA: hypothetical protein VE360_16735, partial [Pyrinomonadaceae bacterium]|nr:hypothetical protein [Pyrinomonadaceae bacterium]
MNSSVTAKDVAGERAWQRCAEPRCGARYGIDERLYVCPRCGGLLDVEGDKEKSGDAQSLRDVWAARRASSDARDRSGVWRFRELLPFDEAAPVVTLGEG